MYNIPKKTLSSMCLLILMLFLGNGPLFGAGVPGPDPLDDIYEENDEFDDAVQLTEGSYSLINLDYDWFWVNCSRNQYVTFSLEVNSSDYQLYMEIYDANEWYIKSSGTYQGSASNSLFFPDAEIVYISIHSFNYPVQRIEYNFTIEIINDFDASSNDRFETNNAFESATVLSTGNYSNLRLIPGDRYDYYKFSVPKNHMIKVCSTQDLGNGYLSISFLDKDENYLTQPYVYYGDKTRQISYFVRQSTEIYLRCYSYLDEHEFLNYSLSISMYDPRLPLQLTYAPSIGDSYIYNVGTSFEMEASNAVYSKMTEYFKENSADISGAVTIGDDFNVKSLVSDFTEFVSTETPVKYTIKDLYSLEKVGLLPSNEIGVIGYQDTIEGLLEMQQNGKWVTPAEYSIAQLEEIQSLLQDNFDAKYYEKEFEESLTENIESLEEFTEEDFQYTPFQTHNLLTSVFWEELDANNYTLADGTLFPQPPIASYIPTMLVENYFMDSNAMRGNPLASIAPCLCFPQEFSFAEYFAWMDQVSVFLKTYAQENDHINENADLLNITFASFLESIGIQDLTVKDTSLGMTWLFDAMNYAEIDNLMEIATGEEPDESFEIAVHHYLLDQAIDPETFHGKAGIALEYDEDRMLSSFVFYFEGTGQANFTEAEDVEEMPEIEGEEISISGSFSFVRDGLYAPSLQQIEMGELGNLRDMTQAPRTPILESIPGYSGVFLGCFGVMSILGIIVYIRTSKSVR